jgi:hypothetical protein
MTTPHGFSASSLRQQEHILVRHTSHFLTLLHSNCQDGLAPINAERWYNYLTFDITGDLIVGETFGCLSDSSYRSWIALLVRSMQFSTSMTVLALLSLRWLPKLAARAAGLFGANPLGPMAAYNDALVRRHMALPPGRPDLFEGLVRRQKELGFSQDKMCANAFILILGGSETTATTLAGATYKLLTHLEVYARLKAEVRGAFGGVDEITVTSVNGLTYMLAVLNEALRMYPPIASNLVREVPRGGVEVAGRFMPGGVSPFFGPVKGWANLGRRRWWKSSLGRFIIARRTGMSRGRSGRSDGSGMAVVTRRSRTIIWSRCRRLALGRGTASGGSRSPFPSPSPRPLLARPDTDIIVSPMP